MIIQSSILHMLYGFILDIWYISAHIQSYTYLGGGFKYFWCSPLPGEKWSNLTSICFNWVGSTTNQIYIHTLASFNAYILVLLFSPPFLPNQCNAFPRWSRAMEPTKVRGGKLTEKPPTRSGLMIRWWWWYIYIYVYIYIYIYLFIRIYI